LKILKVLLFVAGALPAFAQMSIDIGPEYTYQNVWMLNTDDFDAGAELDYNISFGQSYGVVVGLNFSNKIGLRSGVLINQLGQTFRADAQYNAFEIQSIKTSYLKIPFALKYNGDNSKSTTFLMTIGGAANFLTKATIQEELSGETSDFEDRTSINPSDIFSGLDYTASTSFGMRINASENVYLTFLLKGDYSLFDIEQKSFESNGVNYYSNLRIPGGEDRGVTRNLAIGFSLGLFYTLD